MASRPRSATHSILCPLIAARRPGDDSHCRICVASEVGRLSVLIGLALWITMVSAERTGSRPREEWIWSSFCHQLDRCDVEDSPIRLARRRRPRALLIVIGFMTTQLLVIGAVAPPVDAQAVVRAPGECG